MDQIPRFQDSLVTCKASSDPLGPGGACAYVALEVSADGNNNMQGRLQFAKARKL